MPTAYVFAQEPGIGMARIEKSLGWLAGIQEIYELRQKFWQLVDEAEAAVAELDASDEFEVAGLKFTWQKPSGYFEVSKEGVRIASVPFDQHKELTVGEVVRYTLIKLLCREIGEWRIRKVEGPFFVTMGTGNYGYQPVLTVTEPQPDQSQFTTLLMLNTSKMQTALQQQGLHGGLWWLRAECADGTLTLHEFMWQRDFLPARLPSSN